MRSQRAAWTVSSREARSFAISYLFKQDLPWVPLSRRIFEWGCRLLRPHEPCDSQVRSRSGSRSEPAAQVRDRAPLARKAIWWLIHSRPGSSGQDWKGLQRVAEGEVMDILCSKAPLTSNYWGKKYSPCHLRTQNPTQRKIVGFENHG